MEKFLICRKFNFMKIFMMNPVKIVVENLYARIMR